MKHSAALLPAFLLLGTGGRLGLPEPLADYRSWQALEEAARPVPRALAVLCAPLSKRRFEEIYAAESKTYGLHTGRYIRVFANPVALQSLRHGDRGAFPAGAVVVKEKLVRPDDRAAEAVAFMIKHQAGEFTESGGWEFRYYPMFSEASYASCVECHRDGGARDYVFSRPKASRTTMR